MKILKIFGIVVGIHLFALILIFANPGCSSTTKPPPAPADTLAKTEPAPMITVPNITGGVAASTSESAAPAATVPFNPDAPATYGSSNTVRFMPTRPNTPVASALQTQPVSDVTPATTYTVKSGDSLWTIAKRNHVTVAELATANNLKASSTLHEGQKLIVPGKTPASATTTRASTAAAVSSSTASTKAAAATASAPKASSGDEVKHVVKPGETLGAIARTYGVKTKDIAVRNNIADPQKLQPGTELVIPGWQAPASGGRSGRAAAADTSAKPAASPAPKPAESSPVFNILEPEQTPPPAPAGNVPVIKIDENPTQPNS